MLIDFHTHPLAHRYSYDSISPARLTERDKDNIRGLIDLGMERGLDAIGITDHDLCLSGLWALEYVEQEKLPITIVPGCECELYFRAQWIHILALNLKEPLAYTAYTPAEKLIEQIQLQGAVAVLAHPMCYGVDIYHALKGVLDGMEYRNGAQELRGVRPFSSILDQDGYQGIRMYNSDYHYPDKRSEEQWQAMTKINREEFDRWFGI